MTPELARHIKRVHPQICAGGVNASVRDVLAVIDSADHVVVARVDGVIRAHAEARRNPFSPYRAVVSCAVEPEYQGRGLGRETLGAVLEWCDDHGVQYVDGTAWASNTTALALDESLGFRVVGRIDDAYRRDGVSYDQLQLVRRAKWSEQQ